MFRLTVPTVLFHTHHSRPFPLSHHWELDPVVTNQYKPIPFYTFSIGSSIVFRDSGEVFTHILLT